MVYLQSKHEWVSSRRKEAIFEANFLVVRKRDVGNKLEVFLSKVLNMKEGPTIDTI